MLYHRFFACTPWTICHKALTIFHKSQKHHRKIVNYRITEKGDLKVFVFILCNLTISSHCTPKWSFCFCVHNPLPWAFLLNHDEMSIFQCASIYYFITDFLIWLSCFTDVLKKYLKIQLKTFKNAVHVTELPPRAWILIWFFTDMCCFFSPK